MTTTSTTQRFLDGLYERVLCAARGDLRRSLHKNTRAQLDRIDRILGSERREALDMICTPDIKDVVVAVLRAMVGGGLTPRCWTRQVLRNTAMTEVAYKSVEANSAKRARIILRTTLKMLFSKKILVCPQEISQDHKHFRIVRRGREIHVTTLDPANSASQSPRRTSV